MLVRAYVVVSTTSEIPFYSLFDNLDGPTSGAFTMMPRSNWIGNVLVITYRSPEPGGVVTACTKLAIPAMIERASNLFKRRDGADLPVIFPPHRTMVPSRTELPLPVELVRDIFELAADSENPEYAIKFALVSSWVRQWMDSIIYRTVALNFPLSKTELFMRALESKPSEFFAAAVRNLHMSTTVPFEDAQKVISVCRGATRVAYWGSSSTLTVGMHQILPSNIQQLSIKFETLLGDSTSSSLFSADTFPKLTHLEIVNPPYVTSKTSVDWEKLHLIPNLTHIALGDVFSHFHPYMVDVIQSLLTECHSLKVLAIITRDTHFKDLLADAGLLECDRIAILPDFYSPEASELDYWKSIEQEQWNLWQEAERMTQKKMPRMS